MSDLADRISKLSSVKRALLKLAIDPEAPERRDVEIPRRSNNNPVPLSFAQQRLWFLSRYEPESCVYNQPKAIKLSGALNLRALSQALDVIVERHEVLRTAVVLLDDGTPMQWIREPRRMELPVIDISDFPTADQEAELQRHLTRIKGQLFDLSRDLMLRAGIVKLSDVQHVLLLVTHHIASDAWSNEILWRELATLYDAFNNNQPNPLPELPIQYADYGLWQRQRLDNKVLATQLSYWKKQLSGIPALDLPTDRPRPTVQSYRGATQSTTFSKELTGQLHDLSRKENVTLFMTLLAAFQTLLHRYTEQNDIAVGSPITGRTRAETEGVIGFFVNTLVLRGDLSGNPTFRELLRRVRSVALEAYDHQDLPFEKLVEELRPERNLSHSPLFQVMFVLQNAPPMLREFGGLMLSSLAIGNETAKFGLTLSMREETKELKGSLEYSTDLFDAATVDRMIRHFERLLQGIVADPDQRISELPILTDAEKHQLLVEWNKTATDCPKSACLHELFEAQAEKSPDAIAVVFEDQQLTFGELNRRANQVARYLRKLGIGPDSLVAISMERSIEMIVGLLGILKAGGAYVPLDPQYPKQRLAFMLEDTRATVLLTQQRQVEHLYSGSKPVLSKIEVIEDSDLSAIIGRLQVICLDRDAAAIAGESLENPSSGVSAENLAYVIYTSGSTGQPKGVAITHHNVSRLFASTAAWFRFDRSDVWTLFHSYAFDFSVWEIWGALLHGGQLVIVSYWVSRSPELFLDLLSKRRVTVLSQTPAAFHQLMQAEQRSANQELALRLIIFGGEALDFRSLKPWFDRHGDQSPRLVNMYGITETTVHATYQPIGALDIGERLGSPIGVRIPDLELYILDSNRNPAPIGVPGELHIGGVGLARGYINRPELNAEKFIANPFDSKSGARIYKTGDLARFLPNGNIEFLGRTDDQVKIRGFRVEVGEIESALGQHPAVRETVVLARESDADDLSTSLGTGKRLVAYVIANDGCTLHTAELRNFLKQKLPDYMVPSVYVLLDAFPLTSNGKVDRQSLPEPDQSRPELKANYQAPRTPAEEMLVEIWAEVLKLGHVGIHDNFFDLGGHSLLATQVISRTNRVFQVDVPLRSLFESPTVALLAGYVEKACGRERSFRAPAVSRVARGENLPLSFGQQRLWFLDQLHPQWAAYNVPDALRLKGPINMAALEASLNEIVRRHEILRTTFRSNGRWPVQVILPSLRVGLTVVDLTDLPQSELEDETRRRANEEARQPFDLAQGPLVRATLFRLGEEDHLLLLTIHHIVCDGWSLGVFYRELSILYDAFSKGRPSPLPELPVQYADYGVWQRQWLQGEVLETQLSYWKKQLEGVPAVLNLPTDRPRPSVQSYRGDKKSFNLSEELTGALKILSRRYHVTLFMTLLAALQTLLHRYTGQHDIVIGSPIANRNRTEIEGLIGFFVNTLVLRSDLSNNPTFAELLAQVRNVALGAYAHQDLPFEKLVEEFQPERSLSYSPMFQVMFVQQNAPDILREFGGLKCSSFRVDNETTKFDLMLLMREEAKGLKGSLEYSTDLFDAATIDRMIRHFECVLRGIVADPDQRISELPILTESEKHQLLVEWNDTKRDYPKDKCIHELFEEQAKRSPEAIAVVYENRQFTYQELNCRGNQLAQYLCKLGVGPHSLVAISMERSIEMIVAVLGILKAGGAYVPLDPEYPQERLAFMLEDTQAPILLTTRRLFESLPKYAGRLICLDDEWETISSHDGQDLVSAVSGENSAYGIYTSGSTGKPKALTMSHRSLCNLLSWQLENFAEPIPARTLQFASLSFDVSFQEIFATFCSSGTLVLMREELRRDPVGLLRYLQDQSVERMFLPFVALQQLAETAAEEKVVPQTLREIITAGEQLQVTQPIVSLFNKLKDCKLRNHYGPSESHVVTAFTLSGPPDAWSSLPPIGRPIGNTQIFLFDEYLNPVPIGVCGELYIGGDGLAKGYLNRPELTAERFVPHPFSSDTAARLYRTGDLARYRSDGNIEFLGRVDNQVKIRGFRVELGEIESALDQHPAVRETVVLAREDDPNDPSTSLRTDKRLVAYVIANDGSALHVNELRSFLKQKVPDYMVPSVFMLLDGFPLTANGKIDRKALPFLGRSRPELEQSYQAPRTPAEEVLAVIWAEVLKLKSIGVHDNFFDLGGHSLLATQVISRVRTTFHADVALRALFERPTVAELAEAILEQQASALEGCDLAGLLAEIEESSEAATEREVTEVEKLDAD